jgi:hypothetical protein
MYSDNHRALRIQGTLEDGADIVGTVDHEPPLHQMLPRI